VLKGKLAELGHSGHRAIVVHDLADNSGGNEGPANRARSTAASVCPAPSQDSGVLRTKWEHVAGANQIGRPGRWINGREHRGRTIRG